MPGKRGSAGREHVAETQHRCAYEDEEFPDSRFGAPLPDGRRKHLGTEHFDDGTWEYDPPLQAPPSPE